MPGKKQEKQDAEHETKTEARPDSRATKRRKKTAAKTVGERGDVQKGARKAHVEEQQMRIIPSLPPKRKDDMRRHDAAIVGKTLSKLEMTELERQMYERHVAKNQSKDGEASMEMLDVMQPFRMIGQRSPHTDLRDLYDQCPLPQPPLTKQHLRSLQLNEDQALIIAEQIGKMKSGMERLQEIVRKFNCAERYKQDIDFLIENAAPAIQRFEAERALETGPRKEI